MALTIKLWGVRGSLPAPHAPAVLETRIRSLITEAVANSGRDIAKIPAYLLGGYGGHTPCVEVNSSQQQIIIDAGSGLRPLGDLMSKGPCGSGNGQVHLLFTHFHWDHLMGLPFFAPIFMPGNTIHVYSVQPDLPEVFRTLFKKPYFPVPLEKLGAKIEYHRLKPRKAHQIGDIEVTPYRLDHPDPCWGFKIQSQGKVFSHCVDTESKRVSQEQLGPDLPLYQSVDLMLFDAQYSVVESIERMDWGHASAAVGMDIAFRERVKKIVFMHHDPASTDEKIAAAEAEARRYWDALDGASTSGTQWLFAREGMVFEI